MPTQRTLRRAEREIARKRENGGGWWCSVGRQGEENERSVVELLLRRSSSFNVLQYFFQIRKLDTINTTSFDAEQYMNLLRPTLAAAEEDLDDDCVVLLEKVNVIENNVAGSDFCDFESFKITTPPGFLSMLTSTFTYSKELMMRNELDANLAIPGQHSRKVVGYGSRGKYWHSKGKCVWMFPIGVFNEMVISNCCGQWMASLAGQLNMHAQDRRDLIM
ncbi:hypothetical protein RHGRI_037219 [Rhododendron griersonianum]|uniref:Uncharacterized protein n=1 Tax=Rhododendron griersonianum TaxID=479676 RepID=A0AAV6HWE0_9ERIC|nr:hypothetical protein RHGRI_037219 [Rhododendron griersonianum]KAG5516431.1 hypothetical protein RHGRI_037219 [Rhododendron griersonianum]